MDRRIGFFSMSVHKNDLITSNQRYGHWQPSARKTRELRDKARALAIASPRAFPRPLPAWSSEHPCEVRAIIAYPSKRRADPPNVWPTVKAILDGLTDAGVWPDDNSDIITRTIFERDPRQAPKDTYNITLLIAQAATRDVRADIDEHVATVRANTNTERKGNTP